MKPSTSLDQQRQAVRSAVVRYQTTNPRVFGSVLRGDDADGCNLDLLVEPLPAVCHLESALSRRIEMQE